MKTRFALAMLVTLALLAIPTSALAAGRLDGQVILGDTFTLASGETVHGDLLIIGGVVTLEEGSLVEGDVVLLGGTLSVDGTIEGDLAAMGGTVSLGSHALIRGSLTRMGAVISRSAGAVVEGQELDRQVFDLPRIDIPYLGPTIVPFHWWSWTLSIWTQILWVVVRSLLMGALAVLIVMVWPEQATRVARAMADQPILSGGLGMLSLIVIPLILLALAITFCLLPVAVFGFVVFGAAIAFGVIALGLEFGKRMGHMFMKDYHPAAAAGLGTLFLALVAGGIGMIDCIGWVAPFLVFSLGLGGVILTRFGTRLYVASAPPMPPAIPPVQSEEPSE
jgi:hypothetical protein